MIGKLNITPHLVLSAARVLRDYCDQCGEYCKHCVIENNVCKHGIFPCDWELPDGDDDYGETN